MAIQNTMNFANCVTFGAIFMLLLISDRQCAGLHCYVGAGHKNLNASQLQNVDCAVQSQTSGSPTAAKLHQDSSYSVDATNCIIFYNPLSDEAEFGCDRDGVCTVSRGTQTNSACYKKRRGSLRCCQGDLCNDQSYLFHLSPPQAATTCYSGTNNGTLEVVEVKCPTSWCYHNVLRSGGRIINQTFGCDSECESSGLPMSIDNCKEMALPGGLNRRTCICSADRCNSKIDIIDNPLAPSSPIPSTSPSSFVALSNPGYEHGEHSRSTMVHVLVPVCAGVMALLLLVLVAIVAVRYREQRAKAVSFTYAQLTADLAEEPTDNGDDDQLLVG